MKVDGYRIDRRCPHEVPRGIVFPNTSPKISVTRRLFGDPTRPLGDTGCIPYTNEEEARRDWWNYCHKCQSQDEKGVVDD